MVRTNRRSSERLVAMVAMVAAALVGSACSSSSDSESVQPATVEEVGVDLWRVQLTEQAARRTGVETAEVTTRTVDGEGRLVIPYSAVMYHFDGSTWTYTSPAPLTYLREPIEIDFIEGDLAFLTSGPEIGTIVVSVGAAELYGVEFGIGK